MAKTISITCINCKEEFITEPYFYNASIIIQRNPSSGSDYRVARVFAKAVCPYCGETNTPVCECDIYERDIIDLAIRRYKRG
jgi:hypothetical protein